MNEPILTRIKNEAILTERKRIVEILEKHQIIKNRHYTLKGEKVYVFWIPTNDLIKIKDGNDAK